MNFQVSELGQEGGYPRSIRSVVVDDSEFMRAYLGRLLTHAGDFELVGTANDGRQAVQVACALKPELILMDIRMPFLDGLEATRIIKKCGVEQGYSPKIIVVTSEYPLAFRRRAEEAGADGFVAKSATLSAKLKLALRRLFFTGDGLTRARLEPSPSNTNGKLI